MLVHAITEAEKPPTLPSESWDPREHKISEGLRARHTKGRRRLLSQLKQVGREQIFLCLLVYSGPQQYWMVLTHIGRGICFTQSTNANANVFQKHPQKHTPN